MICCMLCGVFISVILNSTDERGRYVYFKSLYKVGVEGRHKWKDIGRALNLNPKDLNSIEQSCRLPGYRFKKMLLKWFQGKKDCSLNTFFEALNASHVELVSLIPRVDEAITSRIKEIPNSEFHLSLIVGRLLKLYRVGKIFRVAKMFTFSYKTICNSYSIGRSAI